MKRNTFALLLASGFVGAMSAQGSIVVYSDDFEDETPTVAGTLPTIGGSNVGSAYQGLLGEVSVESNPEVLGNTSSQALKFGGGIENSNRYQALFAGGAQLIDGMTVSWDFYNQGGGVLDTNDSVRIAFFDDDGLGPNRDVFMRNDRDTLIKLDGSDQGNGAGTGLNNYGEDVWQNFVAMFTLTSPNNYTLDWTLTNLETSTQISGSQAITTIALQDGTALGLHFEINDTNNDDSNYFGYLDNVSVEVVPEPASLALLAMGGLLVTSRRRRGSDQ
ncbi:MAG: PEP-CTERM sorting domain-containing protein [Planctomycetota bacterium]